MPADKRVKGHAMLGETITRLKAKMAMSHVSCLDCYHFDRAQIDIINYEGEKVRILRGCPNYRDCQLGGHKSLWAVR